MVMLMGEKYSCPVCQNATLEEKYVTVGSILKRKIKILECPYCGTRFEKVLGNRYKLNWFNVNNYSYLAEIPNNPRNISEWNKVISQHLFRKILIESLQSGELLDDVKLVVSAPIIPKKNEVIYLGLPNISFYEPRRYTIRNYGGGGFRVAKGVYIGGGTSVPYKFEKIDRVDVGSFVVTNSRIVFVGQKRTLTIPYKKLVSLAPHNKGILIGKEGREKPLYFEGFTKFSIQLGSSEEYTTPISGDILVAFIQGVLNKNSQ